MNSYDSNSILLSPEVDISYPWTCSFPLSLDGTSLPGEDVTTAPYSYKNMLDLTAKLPQNAAGFYFPVSVARSPTTSSNFDVSACVSPALSGPDSGESDGHAQATTSKTPEVRFYFSYNRQILTIGDRGDEPKTGPLSVRSENAKNDENEISKLRSRSCCATRLHCRARTNNKKKKSISFKVN